MGEDQQICGGGVRVVPANHGGWLALLWAAVRPAWQPDGGGPMLERDAGCAGRVGTTQYMACSELRWRFHGWNAVLG